MKRIWKVKGGVVMTQWNDSDRWLFSFKTDFDRCKILEGCPWTFDNALLLLEVMDGRSDPLMILLQVQKFWVRVSGLPLTFQSSEFGERIGSKLGSVHRVIGRQEGDSAGRFLRIRVGFNIHRPLHRWVLFQPNQIVAASKYQLEYENLPYFCLYCGRLSHVCSGCQLHKVGKVVEKQYGRWKTS
ncbi:hypothetical protein M0R45_015504 [Rubus argutus]|uniref:DUF4283 domain-containing protein n=1 Tax=Rubus argutus TaxID=59490 RepID=A0AAW1XPZ7_RUBAR